MKTILFFLMMLITTSVFAQREVESRAGNGGEIEKLLDAELKDREVLSAKDIDQIVVDRGLEIKERFIVPIFEKFLLEDSAALNYLLRVFQQTLEKEGIENLMVDIKYTHIVIGECNGSTTCSGKGRFSDIVIDKEAVRASEFGVSFSELVGLIAHEYLHHYFDEVPGHDKYELARYVKHTVVENEFNERTYSIKQMVEIIPTSAATRIKALYQGDPNNFCKKKGHIKGAKSFVTYELDGGDALRLGVTPNKRIEKGKEWTIYWYPVAMGMSGKYERDGFFDSEMIGTFSTFSSITCYSK
jgi:hypothetical protein